MDTPFSRASRSRESPGPYGVLSCLQFASGLKPQRSIRPRYLPWARVISPSPNTPFTNTTTKHPSKSSRCSVQIGPSEVDLRLKFFGNDSIVLPCSSRRIPAAVISQSHQEPELPGSNSSGISRESDDQCLLKCRPPWIRPAHRQVVPGLSFCLHIHRHRSKRK